ncbi:purine nucleoside phosphorylase [Synergistales bacterium]|nr:purine nucleoside phosphorylase [Synergistales bacterium]
MIFDERIYYENAAEALQHIQDIIGHFKPKTAVVLGTGLGKIANEVQDPIVIETKNIPHWPHSTAPGHAGQLVFGGLGGRPVVILKGRVHYYEGYTMKDVVFPTRVIGMLGVSQYIATNASGGIDAPLKPGDLVLIKDHINFMGDNPLRGPVEPQWNARFPDMTRAYSPRLISIFEKLGERLGIPLKKGIYIAFSGPSYETPTEIVMARLMGASVVGMSTVPEIIVANSMGLESAVISCVGNPAAGLGGIDHETLTEEEVIAASEGASGRIASLLTAMMKYLQEEA